MVGALCSYPIIATDKRVFAVILICTSFLGFRCSPASSADVIQVVCCPVSCFMYRNSPFTFQRRPSAEVGQSDDP